jgi:hypothetical protein
VARSLWGKIIRSSQDVSRAAFPLTFLEREVIITSEISPGSCACMKAVSLIVVSILMAGCSSIHPVEYSVEKEGTIVAHPFLAPVGVPIAANDGPVSYEFPSEGDLKVALRKALQDLGFSVQENVLVPDSMCKNFNKHPKKEGSCYGFSTDEIDLDNDRLEALKLDRKMLRLVTNSTTSYRISVIACCHFEYEIQFTDHLIKQGTPYVPRETDSWISNSRPEAARTVVELRIALIVKRRQARGEFYPDRTRYDPKPLLDKIIEKLNKTDVPPSSSSDVPPGMV